MGTIADDNLRRTFVQFAETECRGTSPLYYHLAKCVAADDDMLGIAREVPAGQPVPNLLFAAVHYLLYRDPDVPLARFYPNFTGSPGPVDESFPVFRDFVLSRRDAVLNLLRTRLVQTNEVRRCAYLYPAILHVGTLFGDRPLALIDIGTSAGLNLLFDRYRFDYGDGILHGADAGEPAGRQFEIVTTLRGGRRPRLDLPMPRISHRIGVDLHIVDVTDPDQAQWLVALVWPEHDDRRDMLQAAIGVRREWGTLDLREGDGFVMAPEIALTLPADVVPCLFHTHVINQIPKAARMAYLARLSDVGRARDIAHVYNNVYADIHLTAYRDGETLDYALAKADGHVRWIEWLS